jgi:hypothetical protein
MPVGKRLLLVVAVLSCSLASGGAVAASTNEPIRLAGNGLGVVSFGSPTASTIRILTAVLGAPTGHPSAGCTGSYSQTAWHDLIAQFKNGRFAGYRYLAGGVAGITPTTKTLRTATVPKLATPAGITLEDTFAEVRHAYPTLRQSGTDFWRTPSGIVFGFDASGKAVAASPIYEIKNNVCPGSL